MNKAETKEKGDIGLTQVIAHLQLNDIRVALPLSEHLPFDAIAIDKNAKLSKISIKYRSISPVSKSIEVPLRTISSNSQGYKIKMANLDEIDAFVIYCPDNRKCYYVPSCMLLEYKSGLSLTLGTIEDKRNKNTSYNWAYEYEDPNKIFWRDG